MAGKDEVVDIPYNELLDWLRSRNLLHSSYPQHLKAISALTTSALSTLPPSLTPHISTTSSFSYLTALHFRSLLLSSSPSPPPTTWLGKYADPTLHQWDNLCRQYEKRHVYLAELARLLLSHVDFELPETRREVGRCGAALTDLSRRIAEGKKAVEGMRERYRQQCETIGVRTGERSEAAMQRQIIDGIDDVHALLTTVVAAAQQDAVGEAIEYYQRWSRWVTNADPADAQKMPLELPTLRRVRHLSPDQLMPDSRRPKTDESSAGEVWNIRMEGAGEQREAGEAPATINWDAAVEVESRTQSDVSIQWDDDADSTTASPDTSHSSPSASLTSAFPSSSSTAPASSTPAASAVPDPTGLLSPAFRSAFLCDVSELTAFLSQRLADLSQSQSTHSPLLSYLHSALPPALHLPSTSPSTLTRLLASLQSLTTSLHHRRLSQCLTIASSPPYVQQLVRGVVQSGRGIERGEREVRRLEERWRETCERREREQERVERMVVEVRAWKAKVEEAVSLLIGRRAQLIGAIHAVLSA